MRLRVPPANQVGNTYFCPIDGCPWKSDCRTSYARHYNGKHRRSFSLLCEDCGAGFHRADAYRAHVFTCEKSREGNLSKRGRNPVFAGALEYHQAYPDDPEEEFEGLRERVRQVEAEKEDLVAINIQLRTKNVQLTERVRELEQNILEEEEEEEEDYEDEGDANSFELALSSSPRATAMEVEENQETPVAILPPRRSTKSYQVTHSTLGSCVGKPGTNVGVQSSSLAVKSGPGGCIREEESGGAKVVDTEAELPLHRTSSRVPAKERYRSEVEKVLASSVPEELGLEVRETATMGLGVFSLRGFRQGEPVCEYKGEVITGEEAKERVARRGESSYEFYFMEGRRQFCIDASLPTGHPGRLVNHSKKLFNLIPKKVPGQLKLMLVSSTAIPVNQQLFFDYNDSRRQNQEENLWLKS